MIQQASAPTGAYNDASPHATVNVGNGNIYASSICVAAFLVYAAGTIADAHGDARDTATIKVYVSQAYRGGNVTVTD